jgi:hypothetical protein
MTRIYDQHDTAFKMLSAYVVLDGKGDKVATIAIKFPRDGAGRLYAYVHWIGSEMVRGSATGYGYDKRSAACSVAAHNLPFPYQMSEPSKPNYISADSAPSYDAFRYAMMKDDGRCWDNHLEAAGFRVLQAV